MFHMNRNFRYFKNRNEFITFFSNSKDLIPKEDLICELCKGKDVLDIGSVGQTDKYSLWNLFQKVRVKSLTGIDLPQAKNIAIENFHLDKKTLNVDKRIVSGNMEFCQFNKKFDVIIAGDVLEHVENQGLFLKNIHNHLKNDGLFIMTTPNAKWVTAIFKPNPTHTLWHDRYTLARIFTIL